MAARSSYDRLALQAGTLQLPAKLDSVQRALLEQMLQAYEAFRASRGDQQESILEARSVILQFIGFAGGIPGQVTEGDYERWGAHLRLSREPRKLARATLRKYQTHIRRFFAYLLDNVTLRNAVRRALDADIFQVATQENSILHSDENERVTDRRGFTGEECQAFFTAIKRLINEAYWSGWKEQLLCLQRDQALFTLVRAAGLRASEAVSQNLTTHEPAHSRKEMGNWGALRVFGKGSKWRVVPLAEPELRPVMDWYLEQVRPAFPTVDDDAQKALFLTPNGKRLGYQGFYKRFRLILDAANLPIDLVPHSLRHSSITDDQLRYGLSVHAAKHKAGHVNAATTQGYTHVPTPYIDREYTKVMQRRLRERGVKPPDEDAK